MHMLTNAVSVNVASLHQTRKPCYANSYLASLVMVKLTEQEEAERLRERFTGVNRAEFARLYGVPGGAAMIYQHITGRRPISIEAAQAYAKGFGCRLEDISPRLADEARKALGMEEQAPSELLSAWELLTQDQRQQFVARIRDQADTNKAILEQLSPPEVKKRTVSVSERRLQQAHIPFAERRKKNAKENN